MKKLLKMSAFLAAMMLALAFVACSSDDDGSSVVTTWTSGGMTLNCFDDNSFEVTADGMGTVAKGTYDGDTTKDGTIKVTITHLMDDDGYVHATKDPKAQEVEIKNGEFSINIPGFGEHDNDDITFTKK